MAITYCIMCNLTGEKYYGSTKQTLQKRMNGHKCLKINKSLSRQIIERGDYDAYVLGTYETKEEALLKEDWYIRNKVCINKQSALRSKEEKEEYSKKWRKDNPEKVKKQKKEYYEKNKEQKKKDDKKYREKNKEKIAQYKKEWEKNKCLNKDIKK